MEALVVNKAKILVFAKTIIYDKKNNPTDKIGLFLL